MFYMIEEMSLKYLLGVSFWTVLPRDIFRNSIKSLCWSIFEKSSIIDVRLISKESVGNNV